MGYSTTFEGEFKFTSGLTPTQLAKVQSFCGEDCREHPEWIGSEGLTWMDIELLPDFSGITWDGSEKTYDMAEKIDLITINMRIEFPDFGLIGYMYAEGEDSNDRYTISIGKDGLTNVSIY